MTILVYSTVMKTLSISEAKATLSQQLRHVRRGEVIVITDRGMPVARLVPANDPLPSLIQVVHTL